jgi:hypothetical protein
MLNFEQREGNRWENERMKKKKEKREKGEKKKEESTL